MPNGVGKSWSYPGSPQQNRAPTTWPSPTISSRSSARNSPSTAAASTPSASRSGPRWGGTSPAATRAASPPTSAYSGTFWMPYPEHCAAGRLDIPACPRHGRHHLPARRPRHTRQLAPGQCRHRPVVLRPGEGLRRPGAQARGARLHERRLCAGRLDHVLPSRRRPLGRSRLDRDGPALDRLAPAGALEPRRPPQPPLPIAPTRRAGRRLQPEISDVQPCPVLFRPSPCRRRRRS